MMSLILNQGQAEFVQMRTGIDLSKIIVYPRPIKLPPGMVTTMALGEEGNPPYTIY